MTVVSCVQYRETSKVDKVGVSTVVKKDLCGPVQTVALLWNGEQMVARQIQRGAVEKVGYGHRNGSVRALSELGKPQPAG